MLYMVGGSYQHDAICCDIIEVISKIDSSAEISMLLTLVGSGVQCTCHEEEVGSSANNKQSRALALPSVVLMRYARVQKKCYYWTSITLNYHSLH